MGKIGDISKYQKSAAINWPTFAKQFDLLFIRVQYGSTGPDVEYGNHTAKAVEHGVPFYSYAFPRFVSVADAKVEASDAAKRQHANSLGMVIDIESEYDAQRNPLGITKLPQDMRLEGIKAFVAELRAQGVKRVGGYIAHNVYDAWGIASIIGLFDFVWIPRYGGPKPLYSCDLWQHTEAGQVDGYNGPVDLSVLNGNKPLEWFTCKPNQVSPVFCTKTTVLQTLRCDGPTDIRKAPDHRAEYVRDTAKGEVFHVFDKVTDANGHVWNNLGGANWVDETSGVFYWLDNPALKAAPAPQYYVIKAGDTLGKIAANNGTSIAQLKAWNGIQNENRIFAGQKIRVK